METLVSVEEESLVALTEEEKSRVREIQEKLDLNDPDAVIRFGTDIQSKISEFADTILGQVRAKDTEYIGNILSELMLRIKELHVDSLGNRILSRIPFVKPIVDTTKKFISSYRSVSVQIVGIVSELEKAKAALLRDIGTLDSLYEKNLAYFKELNLFILAGKMKLLELRGSVIPGMESAAEKSNDPAEMQKYRDMVHLAGRIEKKLHDLALSRAISLQTGPQIRLVQANNQALAEKIQSSILNTIPLWKNQVIIAVSLMRQRKILALQKDVSGTTREILLKNAEMIKENSTEAAKEAEAGIIDIETLKKINADLISTIEETIEIQQEGRIRRSQAREDFLRMERELKEQFSKLKELQKTIPAANL